MFGEVDFNIFKLCFCWKYEWFSSWIRKKIFKSQFEENIKGGISRKDSAPMWTGRRKPVRANYIYNLFRPRASALTEIAELAKVTSLDLLLIFLSFFNSFLWLYIIYYIYIAVFVICKDFKTILDLLNLGLDSCQIFFIRLLLLKGKSLLELWATTFLHDWQPHLLWSIE